MIDHAQLDEWERIYRGAFLEIVDLEAMPYRRNLFYDIAPRALPQCIAALKSLYTYSGVLSMLRAVLDECYPPDIFAMGEDETQSGPRLLSETRKLLERFAALREQEKELESLREMRSSLGDLMRVLELECAEREQPEQPHA